MISASAAKISGSASQTQPLKRSPPSTVPTSSATAGFTKL
jgi:hypothetical protein